MQFEKLAEFYDLLYKDKDYAKEVDYIESIIERYHKLEQTTQILNVGCGTGRHDIYLADKAKVIGIDKAPEMIKLAKKNLVKFQVNPEKLSFINSGFEDLPIENCQFEVVLSLFHVMCYLTSNEGIIRAFANVNKVLKQGGLFVFDYWYTPAVFKNPAEKRVKNVGNNKMSIERVSKPQYLINENTIEVDFNFMVSDKLGNSNTFNEKHRMRHFSIPEIELLSKYNEFEILEHYEWMTLKEPDSNSWYVLSVLRKL